MSLYKWAAAAASCLAAPSLAFASCGSAFCTVNSNWTSESASSAEGSVFDLRYEYINQNQPRSGGDKVAVGQIPRDHDEVNTANRNLLATYSRTFSSGWGFTVVAPLVDRSHFHLHNDDGGQTPERWNFTELGDVRLLGRYQRPVGSNFSAPATAGLIFGLKLPTGRTNLVNSAGDVAERTLQPGTGTTDGVLGAYYHQALPKLDSSWFAQVQIQHPLNSHADYRPGNQFGADIGFRYGVTEKVGALLQINAFVKTRDSGAQAEPEDSGGRYISLSPGLSYSLTDKVQVYGFLQLPVYQRVNGVQLTANKALVAGLTTRF